MLVKLLSLLNIVHIVLLFTFFFAFFGLDWKNRTYVYVKIILFTFLCNETIDIITGLYNCGTGINMSITNLIHFSIWLLILKDTARYPTLMNGIIIGYITFGLCNLFFGEGTVHFNYYTFILGTLLYLIVFIIESFYHLNKEHFSFFTSNHYILLVTPLVFFIGLSLIFGFRSRSLNFTILFGTFRLYKTVMYISNAFYYSLFNLYIYREYKKERL